MEYIVRDAKYRLNMCVFEELPVALLPLLLDAVEFVEHDQVPTFMPLCNEERSEIAREPIVTDHIYCRTLITEKHDP